ncbi:PREDICTED: LOW QUALITY PROTEIN: GTP-binding protein Rhes-like [Apaloderma vittatum]|uniref:LOW QUALITY PROTEIN: GTP-binding protein Rhes-like n=1 Tax=Apaloderma vittatum TaxID=57397 RepID=UPI000521C7FE|nr:PREDICTED: LOW QUALITY PROTEIN: GTP-binding protein Rhes-like [Apaloderma vittatum]
MSLVVKEKNHVRLVFLGAAGVGKTALIRRFLMDTFEPKHRRTVEELHSKEYEVSGATVKVEILDTSGSYSFPAMRELSVQNSAPDAFALVYAVDDAESFESVKSLREEILEVKEDKFPPIVPSRFVETSAKDNENVLEVFRELLQQANLPSRLSPALCKRRETLPKEQTLRPPMNKTNSCSVC